MEALGQPLVSVVIPSYRSEAGLEDTLADLAAQDYARYEVLVIDQGPNPQARDGATVYWLAERDNSIARNVGIREARGEIVAFIDDDVRLGPGFLSAHVAAHTRPGVACVAGWVDSPRDDSVWKPKSAEVESPASCNWSARRRALIQAGGFDSFLREPGTFAESELAHRLRRAGHKIQVAPEALATKPAAGPPADRSAKWWSDYAANMAHVFWKTRRLERILLLPWTIKLYLAVRGLSNSALGPWAAIKAVQDGVGSATAALYAKNFLERTPPAQQMPAPEPRL